MPANILSSNLITIPVLDTLLSSITSPPSQAKRVQLLSTKLAILTNRPSQPARGQPFEIELQILRTRLDLASAHLVLAEGKGIGELKLAESELNLVERECKGIIKRYSRLVKQERDKAQTRASDEGHEAGDPAPDVSGDTTTTTTPSPYTPSNDDISAQTSRLSDLSITSFTPDSSTLDSTMTTPPMAQSSTMTPSSSTSTSTAPGTPSTPSSGEMTKRQKRLKLIMDIRVEGLKMSILVEDKAGRGDRKLRLEGIVSKLEAG